MLNAYYDRESPLGTATVIAESIVAKSKPNSVALAWT